MVIDEDIYLEHFDDESSTDQELVVFLEHFGVKGMKWGIRNENKPSGKFKKTSNSVSDSNDTKKKQFKITKNKL